MRVGIVANTASGYTKQQKRYSKRIDLKTHPKVWRFKNAIVLGLCKWAKRECA